MRLMRLIRSIIIRLVISLFILAYYGLSYAEENAVSDFGPQAHSDSNIKNSIVGIWSSDLESNTKSIVVEFHQNGDIDIMSYDRFNITKFDSAVGKYYIKDNKIQVMLYSAYGPSPYFELFKKVQLDYLDSDKDSLTVIENGKEVVYKLVTQRTSGKVFTLDEHI